MELVALGKEQTEGGTERHMHALSICKSFQLTTFPYKLLSFLLSYKHLCRWHLCLCQTHSNWLNQPNMSKIRATLKEQSGFCSFGSCDGVATKTTSDIKLLVGVILGSVHCTSLNISEMIWKISRSSNPDNWPLANLVLQMNLRIRLKYLIKLSKITARSRVPRKGTDCIDTRNHDQQCSDWLAANSNVMTSYQ